MTQVTINGVEYKVIEEKRNFDRWPNLAKNYAERGIVAEMIVRRQMGRKQWLVREYQSGTMQIVMSL